MRRKVEKNVSFISHRNWARSSMMILSSIFLEARICKRLRYHRNSFDDRTICFVFLFFACFPPPCTYLFLYHLCFPFHFFLSFFLSFFSVLCFPFSPNNSIRTRLNLHVMISFGPLFEGFSIIKPT